MNKVVNDVDQAIADIKDGATIAIGGFFAAGVPRTLLRALIAKGDKESYAGLRIRPPARSGQ